MHSPNQPVPWSISSLVKPNHDVRELIINIAARGWWDLCPTQLKQDKVCCQNLKKVCVFFFFTINQKHRSDLNLIWMYELPVHNEAINSARHKVNKSELFKFNRQVRRTFCLTQIYVKMIFITIEFHSWWGGWRWALDREAVLSWRLSLPPGLSRETWCWEEPIELSIR